MSMDTAQLTLMLLEKYKEPEYLLLTEVPNATGMKKSRTADAMAFSLWPSRGLTITGFELKVSRSDWLKERDDPAKAESLARYCDFWYLVVADKNIVQNGELPATWGLIAPRGSKLVVTKDATQLPSENISRGFLMSVLRRAFDSGKSAINLQAKLDESYRRGYASGKAEHNNGSQQRIIAELERTIADFEMSSGMKMTPWSAGRIGEIVHLLDKYGVAGFSKQIEIARDNLSVLSERMGKLLLEFNGAKETEIKAK